MRVAQAARLGGPEVLELVEVDTPEPGEGQLRVAVRASAVNPADLKMLRGEFGSPSLPIRPGYEVSGVVEAIGAGVAGFAVGDEVIVHTAKAGYSDAVLAGLASVFPKPAAMSFAEAASLLSAGTTAWHLAEATRVGAGDTVLIHGASGSVGAAAVQLAVLRGARVIGTAGEHSLDRVRALGAEAVRYGDGLLDRVRSLAPEMDAALDTVGTPEAIEVSLALVADRSRIATIVAFDSAHEHGFQALGGGPGADPGTAIRRAAKPELIRLAAEGRIAVTVGREFPLAEVADALRFSAEGHPGGKIVLVP